MEAPGDRCTTCYALVCNECNFGQPKQYAHLNPNGMNAAIDTFWPEHDDEENVCPVCATHLCMACVDSGIGVHCEKCKQITCVECISTAPHVCGGAEDIAARIARSNVRAYGSEVHPRDRI